MISLTPSDLIEHIYCKRYTYFQYVLNIPQYEEKFYKVEKGRQLHDARLEQNKNYIRKRIDVKNKLLNQYLTNEFLRGEVDEVLFLDDNTAAPLDYKFAEYNDFVYRTHKIQSICYAILIEDNFKIKVNKGYVVYVRSSNKLVEISITDNDKLGIKFYVNEFAHIVENNIFPEATKHKERCLNCTYKNICVK